MQPKANLQPVEEGPREEGGGRRRRCGVGVEGARVGKGGKGVCAAVG